MCAEGEENMDEDVKDVCGHLARRHEGESSEAHASSSIQRCPNGRVLFSLTGTAVKLTEALLEKEGGKKGRNVKKMLSNHVNVSQFSEF